LQKWSHGRQSQFIPYWGKGWVPKYQIWSKLVLFAVFRPAGMAVNTDHGEV